MPRESLEKLVALLNLGRKREIERYCRDLVITSEDLADVLLAARVAGLGPYRYTAHFREFTPEHLEPTDEDRVAHAMNGVGPLSDQARKTVRKIHQIFADRRLLAVHLFFSNSHKHWHMFYFDQRDFVALKNHWEHGPHIHYSQDCFTKDPLELVWKRVLAEKPEFPKSIHIRYDYHHNRHRARKV